MCILTMCELEIQFWKKVFSETSGICNNKHFQRIRYINPLSDILVTWATETLINHCWGCKMAQVILENILAFKIFFFVHFTKLIILLQFPVITLLGICKKELKTYIADLFLHKSLHIGDYSRFIYNCQNLKAT